MFPDLHIWTSSWLQRKTEEGRTNLSVEMYVTPDGGGILFRLAYYGNFRWWQLCLPPCPCFGGAHDNFRSAMNIIRVLAKWYGIRAVKFTHILNYHKDMSGLRA